MHISGEVGLLIRCKYAGWIFLKRGTAYTQQYLHQRLYISFDIS